MEKKFLDMNFERGGTVGKPDETKGNYLGVYLFVLPKKFGKVEFDENHYIAKHNGKNLNYSLNDLKQKWVKDANILYIGRRKTDTVNKRVFQHIKFYNWDKDNKGDNNIPARGGRSIGQIQNFESLEIWYLKCDNPAIIEKDLLTKFKKRYNKLPFANWRE